MNNFFSISISIALFSILVFSNTKADDCGSSDPIIIPLHTWSSQIANMFNCKLNFDTYSTQAAILSSSNSSASFSSLPIIYKTKSGVYGRPISSSSFLFGDGSKKYYINPSNFKSHADKKFLDNISQQAN